MNRSHKFRIYPNKGQEQDLAKHFGCARWFYNWALSYKTKKWGENKEHVSYVAIANNLPPLKVEYPWLAEVNAQSLQAAAKNLDSAFTRFFRLKKGFPKFKSKHNNRQSFQCPQSVKIDHNLSTIKLPKISPIKIVLSQKFEGEIKTVTITKTPTGKYFASIFLEVPDVIVPKAPIDEKTTIGVDLGLLTFATFSTGEKIPNPRFFRKSQKQLKRQQRKLSRKKKGSNNRNKQRRKVSRVHEKVANQRNDFLHKLSTRLVRENQSIAIEDLNVAGMVRNPKLAKSISDASWSEFRRQLTYKCEWYGKNLLIIGRFEPSSKMCTCGIVNQELKLGNRSWLCGGCGTMHDRDILAAKNIKSFALHPKNQIGMDNPEFTPPEIEQ